MNFETQENDIVARLAPIKIGEVQVIPMPESVDEFTRDFEDARVTVAFNGLVSPGTYSTSNILQSDRVSFAVVIQSRKLRHPNYGVYSLYNKVRKLLVGFRPTSCQQMYSKSLDLISDENDLFTFLAMFECEALIVEDYTDPAETAPRITQITVLDPEIIAPPPPYDLAGANP